MLFLVIINYMYIMVRTNTPKTVRAVVKVCMNIAFIIAVKSSTEIQENVAKI